MSKVLKVKWGIFAKKFPLDESSDISLMESIDAASSFAVAKVRNHESNIAKVVVEKSVEVSPVSFRIEESVLFEADIANLS